MNWTMNIPAMPGFYLVWGMGTGGVKAVDIDFSGQVIYHRYPNPGVYSNSIEFASAERILYWMGPILNPSGGST